MTETQHNVRVDQEANAAARSTSKFDEQVWKKMGNFIVYVATEIKDLGHYNEGISQREMLDKCELLKEKMKRKLIDLKKGLEYNGVLFTYEDRDSRKLFEDLRYMVLDAFETLQRPISRRRNWDRSRRIAIKQGINGAVGSLATFVADLQELNEFAFEYSVKERYSQCLERGKEDIKVLGRKAKGKVRNFFDGCRDGILGLCDDAESAITRHSLEIKSLCVTLGIHDAVFPEVRNGIVLAINGFKRCITAVSDWTRDVVTAAVEKATQAALATVDFSKKIIMKFTSETGTKPKVLHGDNPKNHVAKGLAIGATTVGVLGGVGGGASAVTIGASIGAVGGPAGIVAGAAIGTIVGMFVGGTAGAIGGAVASD